MTTTELNNGQTSESPVLLLPEEAAELLRFSIEHVRRLMRKGKIRGIKIGRSWRISTAEIDRLVSQSK